MGTCLDYKSSELEKLAMDVGLEKSNPAFADKIGTLMDIMYPNQSDDIVLELPTKEQVIDYLKESVSKVFKEPGKVSNPQGLMYAECRLPALYKELFDNPYFIDKATGDIDFKKVSDMLPEVMDILGYRIPNEDKYSTLPLKVIGFLPTSSGGGIMLPAEITTISGSDKR